MDQGNGASNRINGAELASIAATIERVAEALKAADARALLPVETIIQHEIAKELAKIDELPKSVRSQAAWNMLLFLYDSDAHGRECISKQLCSVSGAPPTTALRYIQLLVDNGLAKRQNSEVDHRLVVFSITPMAIELVEAWAARRADALSKILLEGRSNDAR